jgi:hypothetical protein
LTRRVDRAALTRSGAWWLPTGPARGGCLQSGPPDLDVGHCRLNLAVLFGADRAEKFRLAYDAEADRAVDPWGDLHALAS